MQPTTSRIKITAPAHKDTVVIIPANNEHQTIGNVVLNVLKERDVSECVVVDDGSSDGTGDIAKTAGAHVISMPVNAGVGSAIKKGLMYARSRQAKNIVFIDADGQHDPSYIRMLICVIRGGADYVIGSRYLTKTRSVTHPIRRLGTALISALIFVVYGVRIYDPTSGYRACNADSFKDLAIYYPTVFSEPEIIMSLIKKRRVIREVSVEMNPRQFGASSISMWKALFLMGYITVILFKDLIQRRNRINAC